MMGGYQQQPGGLYGQPYQQPMNMGGYNAQGMGFNQGLQYQQSTGKYCL